MTVATDVPVSREPDLVDNAPTMPPKFVRSIRKAEVIEGSAAKFDVRVSGNPEPEIVWYKDDKPLKQDSKFRFEEDNGGVFSLFVNDVVAADEGLFKCEASNIKGEVSCSAELVVESKLFFASVLISVYYVRSSASGKLSGLTLTTIGCFYINLKTSSNNWAV